MACLTNCVQETQPDPPQQVIENLIILLKDDDIEVRRTAALSLGKIAEPQSIPALLSSLTDEDEHVRSWSAWALGAVADSLSEEAILGLIQRLADPSPNVQREVILALSRTPSSESLMRVLKEAYAISTLPTQKAIIQTLSHFDFPFSYPLYLKALKSTDPVLRQTSIAGIGESGEARGRSVLRAHLLEDTNVGVRAEAAFRLGKIGRKSDLSALKRAKDLDPTPQVHFWAAWAIDQIQDST